MMQPRIRQSGRSLVEVVTAIAVFGIGMVGAYESLEKGTTFSRHAITRLSSDRDTEGVVGGLADLFKETSPEFVDTNLRYHDLSAGYDYNSDRFPLPAMGLAQCTSSVCRFHTDPNLVVNADRYHFGFEYRAGNGYSSRVAGKLWPSGLQQCPLDGSPLTTSVRMDGVKFFTARSPDGSFGVNAGSDPGPEWQNLVLIFPYSDGTGMPQIRRYDIHVSDLTAPGALFYSPTWMRFNPTEPSMVDLFDFGTDGTTDGVPDGSVPTRSENSDAELDVFSLGTYNGDPAIIIMKRIGSLASLPYRRIQIVVRLEDGYTVADFEYYEPDTSSWSSHREFTRTPRTLVRNVTDFVVSTAASHPYDPTNNPTGVEADSIVRLGLGVTKRMMDKDRVRWLYHTAVTEVAPRN